MKNFKKIKFKALNGNVVADYEGKDKSIDDVIELLKNPNVISITVTRMTTAEALRNKSISF